MEQELNNISINGVDYIRKDSLKDEPAKSFNGMKYCIVRTYSAGVFAGFVESKNGQEIIMRNARRIWYWSGAASLSQLAVDGTSDPKNCKFPVAVDQIELLQVVEILNCTEKAKKSIEGVAIWKM